MGRFFLDMPWVWEYDTKRLSRSGEKELPSERNMMRPFLPCMRLSINLHLRDKVTSNGILQGKRKAKDRRSA